MLKDMKTLLNGHKEVIPPKDLDKENEPETPKKPKRRLSIRELK